MAEKAVQTLRSGGPKPAGLIHDMHIAGVFRGPEMKSRQVCTGGSTTQMCYCPIVANWYLEAPLCNQKEGAAGMLLGYRVKGDHAGHSPEGFRPTSLVELIEREQFTYLILFGVMTSIAAVALLWPPSHQHDVHERSGTDPRNIMSRGRSAQPGHGCGGILIGLSGGFWVCCLIVSIEPCLVFTRWLGAMQIN